VEKKTCLDRWGKKGQSAKALLEGSGNEGTEALAKDLETTIERGVTSKKNKGEQEKRDRITEPHQGSRIQLREGQHSKTQPSETGETQ